MPPKIKQLRQYCGLRDDQMVILPVVPPSDRETYHDWTLMKTVPNEWEVIAEGLPTFESASILKKIIAIFKG